MYSIIMPMDVDRLPQFTVTKRIYDAMPQVKEFIIPTRKEEELRKYLTDNDLMNNVRLIPYTIEVGFNCSKALNIGVRESKYGRIIITSPEVKPPTDLLDIFDESPGNIVCSASDEDEQGNLSPLVSKIFRGSTPAMYFLAVFNERDIEAINGWDEEFMRGYAYEDNDFGDRWVRAGLPFEIREDIHAIHQFHPRLETIKGGSSTNFNTYMRNNDANMIKPMNGLKKL